MAATQLTGARHDDGRWPFRVVPADGTVTQDYTSHLTPAVRFFDDLAARTGKPAYAQARDRAWAWLLANPCNPASASYMRWEGFYEDQDPGHADRQGRSLLGPRDDRRADQAAPDRVGGPGRDRVRLPECAVSRAGFRQFAVPPTNRSPWNGPAGPKPPTPAASSTPAPALLLHQSLEGDPRQDDSWRTTALDMAAVCSHGQNTRGVAADGRMFTTIKDLIFNFHVDNWYEQNFNTVKYFLEIMALEPELAPDDETHILAADRALTSIIFLTDGALLEYATAGDSGR